MSTSENTDKLYSVTKVQSLVEGVLLEVAESLENRNSFISDIFRAHSTEPGKVGNWINYDTLVGKCGILSYSLRDTLFNKHGIVANSHISNNKLSQGHIYLIKPEAGVEVLIDPTIGQFLLGHNHIFVGLREELRQMVLDSYIDDVAQPDSKKFGIKIPFGLKLQGRTTKEDVYLGIWGDTSRIYPYSI